MLFKRLEIAGFKSFAKRVVLEFPSAITAIVGPNGSGKSNVADAIRWVLGEQSMKSLRGKKGEDLIFGGGGGGGSPSSPHVARLSKASVALVFDNVKKIFPYEFDEMIIARAVYRDGMNEYSLNGSPARLRDSIDLLSKVGLGASQHHIIGQGDADRILYATPKERKEMIEEALGLKIFEIKKIESERKLAKTEENIKDAESLRRELRPHVRYLEEQAKKSRDSAALREELHRFIREYIDKEQATLVRETQDIEHIEFPLERATKELEAHVRESEYAFEEQDATNLFLRQLAEFDRERETLLQQQRTYEQEIWRIKEQNHTRVAHDSISSTRARDILDELRIDLEAAGMIGAVEGLRNAVFSLTQKVYRFLEELTDAQRGTREHTHTSEALDNATRNISTLKQKEEEIILSRARIEEEYRTRSADQQAKRSMYRKHSEALAKARDEMREVVARKEQLEARRRMLETDFQEWMKKNTEEHNGDGAPFVSSYDREQMYKKIERMRIRLEEAGGGDEAVIREFAATKERDEFLARELDDLKKAKTHVEEMVKELEERIVDDFTNGLKSINILFAKFFREIFGGGKAEIKLVKPKKQPTQNSEYINSDASFDEPHPDAEDAEPGIEIIVDIPRKRIKSLAMLSGGERALTSIALLFALSTVNPPPFLVLDETDAALDEANSNRYAEMLKELSKKTQLVVITHNRATMKVAPILYGVTMGADGISRILSIKLEEAENTLTEN